MSEHHDGYLVGVTVYAKLAGHSSLKSENAALKYALDHYSWLGKPICQAVPEEAGAKKATACPMCETGNLTGPDSDGMYRCQGCEGIWRQDELVPELSSQEVSEKLREAGIDMKPALARVKAALADERDCLDVAGQIAKAVESYEGDDLLSQIVPHLRPLIGKLQWLRNARHGAIRALDEALGDTDLPGEDESPVMRAFVALTAGADGVD